jgi:hypothetical protein
MLPKRGEMLATITKAVKKTKEKKEKFNPKGILMAQD